MHIILLIAIGIAVLLGPGLWVKRVMERYSRPADRYPMTGARLARDLLDGAGLERVRTEKTEQGDHYDPIEKVVRLSPDNYDGRSLTAITVAAHEVGHALQDAGGFGPLRWRTQLVRWISPIERVGAGLMMASPVMVAVTRAPVAGLMMFLGGLLTLASGILVHATTLPTEFDASFRRALPLLAERRVLRDGDERHARKILRAAAMTYVSASLMSLLNVARWWAILRR
ncbi:zinc metallopeptidase [Lentisalinibacter orientalis]|jgi:Zn-dependent membrane protease YugP|uniref:zinc metallopeptidase n=1 Tax=Lentisalinibacter orientalis TaxID=2992241 RepID=UPI003863CF12